MDAEYAVLVLAVKRSVVVGAILLAAFIGLWTVGVGVAGAEAERKASSDVVSTDAARAEQLARDFWDHPFQRLLYVAMAATDQVELEDCTVVQVSAYAPFGYLADQVWVDCQGVSRDAPR